MFATTLAAAILSITTPAAAPAPAPAAPAAGQSDAAAQPAKGRYNPRVCIVERPTGTMLTQKTCKPLEVWRHTDGIDPLPGK
ncbi:hypothetical protein [Sphingomonas sp. NIC1]|uniref:hypothetical protein n=1 Tax=Sphingomonas sp. NIC1 TaxID=1961362 RepID=UPI0007C10294|nr:hypothetical protein [Sphingomonas sp. NIC1]ANC86116.1 hypothetical protein A7E77_03975 [Sphingomonas sp. NIC1]